MMYVTYDFIRVRTCVAEALRNACWSHQSITRVRAHTYHFLELGLDLLRCKFLAQRGFPQQHITVVGQQLWTLGLWLSLQPHPDRQTVQRK